VGVRREVACAGRRDVDDEKKKELFGWKKNNN
jgi:hypothetical protein